MVKIFSHGSTLMLAKMINDWQEEKGESIDVKGISYAVDHSQNFYSALVHYEKSRKAKVAEALADFCEKH